MGTRAVLHEQVIPDYFGIDRKYTAYLDESEYWGVRKLKVVEDDCTVHEEVFRGTPISSYPKGGTASKVEGAIAIEKIARDRKSRQKWIAEVQYKGALKPWGTV